MAKASLTSCSPIPKDLEKWVVETWKKEILNVQNEINSKIR